MRKYSILNISTLLFFIVASSYTSTAQSKKISLPTFTFTVPDGMKNSPSDSSLLAKLSFENSLHITIDDNMEKMLSSSKKNPMGKTLNMEEFAFDLKFKAIKGQYGGYDATKKQNGTLKKWNYTAQMFICKASKIQEAYLEYRVMEIGGRHYEFIITGKKAMKKKHQPLIKSFWNSIVGK